MSTTTLCDLMPEGLGSGNWPTHFNYVVRTEFSSDKRIVMNSSHSGARGARRTFYLKTPRPRSRLQLISKDFVSA
jgi:hypothetical protein